MPDFPSLPLFNNLLNMKSFSCDSSSNWSPPLSHFLFPNLVSFEFATALDQEEFRAFELLDFLEASPVLQTVYLEILAEISLEGVPRERVVILPNVGDFRLTMVDGEPGYTIAAHVSCPSAKSTSLSYGKERSSSIPEGIFPLRLC
jgi:hypothetical protein